MGRNVDTQAIALPSVASARLARNTQLILQYEADLTRVVDPWAGSYFMESLTAQMEATALDTINKVAQASHTVWIVFKCLEVLGEVRMSSL